MKAEIQNPKRYDLEDRTLAFARRIRALIQKLPKSPTLVEDYRQLIRSSGSVGANYIEANEAVSRKDFILRIKICRKEAKESRYWLHLIGTNGGGIMEKEHVGLVQEALELTRIFGAILQKCTSH